MVPAHWNNKLIYQLVAFTGEDGGKDDIVDTILVLVDIGWDLERELKHNPSKSLLFSLLYYSLYSSYFPNLAKHDSLRHSIILY